MYYPVWLDPKTRRLNRAGNPLPSNANPTYEESEGDLVAAWPVRSDGSQGRWGVGPETMNELIRSGLAACGSFDKRRRTWGITYLSAQVRSDLDAGKLAVRGVDEVTGVSDVVYIGGAQRRARTVWHRSSHDAGAHGTDLIGMLLGTGRAFPFPKSLYAVEDSIRILVGAKPKAIVLDFFAGSGTTAHAVMRLNKQDGGQRQSISVTNNEVSAEEQQALREMCLRPGDAEWEERGICDFITKPRITAAVTGLTPSGEPIKGDYKFTDLFPMAEGFSENVEFFNLTYESPLQVASGYAFNRLAPLLWMRAGSIGPRIDSIDTGWAVSESYGVLMDLDRAEEFTDSVRKSRSITHAFVFTEEDRLFEMITRQLPEYVEVVRMYDAYVRNAEIEAPAVAR
jgi:adenine-specific DNA-methyltransferase